MNCVHCNTLIVSNYKRKKYCSELCRRKKYAIDHPNVAPPVDTGKIGAIGELLVSADLLRKGFEVFRSVSQSCSCDLIAMKNGLLYKVEVRTAHFTPKGTMKFPLSKKDTGRQDFFALVTHDGAIYYVTVDGMNSFEYLLP